MTRKPQIVIRSRRDDWADYMNSWTAPFTEERRGKAWQLLALGFVLLNAWRSETFFHPDEHYQILEFAGFLLGFTPRQALPWEYAAQIRPFLQPTLCEAVIRCLQSFGITDRFVFAAALRLIFGVLYWAALVRLCKTAAPTLSRDGNLAAPYWILLAGFLPYLAVRTSSETFSTALFLFGVNLVLARTNQLPVGKARKDRPTLSNLGVPAALLVGLLFGLAFEARYQTAILIGGFAAWGWFTFKLQLRTLLLTVVGFAVALGVGAWCDRHGYGHWTFPAFEYLRVNVFQGVAKQYGTAPPFAYLYLSVANVFAPVACVLLLGLVLTWLRAPSHWLTWVTFPFFAVHSLLAHKEERFLFPLIPFALLAMCLGFAPAPARPDGPPSPQSRLARAWQGSQGVAAQLGNWLRKKLLGRTGTFVAAWSTAGLVLLTLYPLGWRPHHALYRWVSDAHPNGVVWSVQAPRYPDYPFFRTQPWAVMEDGGPLAAGEPRWIVRADPFDGPVIQLNGASAQLVFSEFPGHEQPFVQRLFPLLRTWRASPLGQTRPFKDTHWYSVYEVAARP